MEKGCCNIGRLSQKAEDTYYQDSMTAQGDLKQLVPSFSIMVILVFFSMKHTLGNKSLCSLFN